MCTICHWVQIKWVVQADKYTRTKPLTNQYVRFNLDNWDHSADRAEPRLRFAVPACRRLRSVQTRSHCQPLMQYHSQSSLNGEGDAGGFHLALTPARFPTPTYKSWRWQRFTPWFWWREISNMHEWKRGGVEGGGGGGWALLTATLSHLGFDQEQTVASFLRVRTTHERIAHKQAQRDN